jgi:Protein of unknown function (DUF1778)
MEVVEMPKNAIITIRVDSEDKNLLEAAARNRGMTLTGFALKTLMREAEREAPRQRRNLKVPILFRTACQEARRGGAGGYIQAGRLLVKHALEQRGTGRLEEDAEVEEYTEGDALQELNDFLLEADEDERALEWCERHFPECLALVPTRRRQQFAEGLIDAYHLIADESLDRDITDRLDFGKPVPHND